MHRVVMPAHNADPLGQAKYAWSFSTVSTLLPVLPLFHSLQVPQANLNGRSLYMGRYAHPVATVILQPNTV